jgi:hypothetical protein
MLLAIVVRRIVLVETWYGMTGCLDGGTAATHLA